MKITKPYKVIIIITFLIALFFFGKWVNDVRPRYEWKERILFRTTPFYLDFCRFEHKDSEICYCDSLDEFGMTEYMEEELFKIGIDGICYIKEKVKIK